MATVEDAIARYEELCHWCESWQQKNFLFYGDYITCKKGCSQCCALSTVNALEAAVISRFIRANNTLFSTAPPDRCPLLSNDLCPVYPVRPVICRSHGLPVISSRLTNNKIDYCPKNFTDFPPENLKNEHIINIDQLTENLVRLNLAFCILLGSKELASQRFPLSELAGGNIPEILII